MFADKPVIGSTKNFVFMGLHSPELHLGTLHWIPISPCVLIVWTVFTHFRQPLDWIVLQFGGITYNGAPHSWLTPHSWFIVILGIISGLFLPLIDLSVSMHLQTTRASIWPLIWRLKSFWNPPTRWPLPGLINFWNNNWIRPIPVGLEE